MKHLASLSLLILSTPVWAATSAPSGYFHTDFGNGSLPSGITVTAEGATPITTTNYKHGGTVKGWEVQPILREYAAVCPTSTGGKGEAVKSVMTLPVCTIDSADAIIYWSARSMMKQRPESYYIQVREVGTSDWTVVARVEAEGHYLTKHAVSLAEYVGKQIEVQLVCDSADRYMLALYEIGVGLPVAPQASFKSVTHRYAQNQSVRGAQFFVEGTLTNLGLSASDLENAAVVVKTGSETIGRAVINDLGDFATVGGQTTVKVPVTLQDNTKTNYTVSLEVNVPDATLNIPLGDNDVITSSFARQLVIDEGTGTWCNNCPAGILWLDEMEEQYPGQCNILTTHANDVISNTDYWPHLGFYAVPYFMLNRISASKGSNLNKFSSYYSDPTIASIEVKEYYLTEDEDGLYAKMDVTFAQDIDNSDGRYGVCYVITAPFYEPDGSGTWRQQNNCSTSTYEQYYFLPSYIPPYLSYYENVTATAQNAFSPVEGLIAMQFGAYHPETVETELEIPMLVDDVTYSKVVAMVIDTTTGQVVNSGSCDFGKPTFDPVEVITAVESGNANLNLDGECVRVSANGAFKLTFADGAGRVLGTAAGEDQGAFALPAVKGFVIVSLTTADGRTASLKVMK